MKLSNTDKRQELARQTEVIQTLLRIGRGAQASVTVWYKLLALLVCMAAVAALWQFRHTILAYATESPLAPLGDLLVAVVLAALAVAVPTALFWAWGGPLKAGAMQDNLRRTGLVNSAGEVPTLLSIISSKDNPNIQILEFFICGIPVSDWMNSIDRIQAALNVTVADIRYGKDNQHILLYVAKPASNLPSMLPWNDRFLPVDNFELVLGESLVGPVACNLAKVPHILMGGGTGSGKSGLLRLLLRQALLKGADVYIADFKGGVDFDPWWHEHCELCFDTDSLVAMLNTFADELEQRKKLFRSAGTPNIDEYNAQAARRLHRIVFACDEVAEVLDRTGMDKNQKEAISQIESKLSLIARQGRAFGLHLILATQRPDANLIPGQIRNNIDFRVCGRADSVLSGIIIDSTAAADMIPKDAQGRFIVNDGTNGNNGTVFQAYWLKSSY